MPTILFVDDYTDAADMFALIVRMKLTSEVVTETAIWPDENALRRADALFTDVCLGYDRCGLSLAKTFKQHHPNRPVVFITGRLVSITL